MKMLAFATILLLSAYGSFGQTVQKGSLLGLHIITAVKLNGNATMEDFKSFFISKVIPAYEKEFQGAKGYLVKGVRGENNNSFGILWLFESEQSRDRYFTADGLSDLGKAAVEKVSAVDKELDRIGTHETKFTDWVVQ